MCLITIPWFPFWPFASDWHNFLDVSLEGRESYAVWQRQAACVLSTVCTVYSIQLVYSKYAVYSVHWTLYTVKSIT